MPGKLVRVPIKLAYHIDDWELDEIPCLVSEELKDYLLIWGDKSGIVKYTYKEINEIYKTHLLKQGYSFAHVNQMSAGLWDEINPFLIPVLNGAETDKCRGDQRFGKFK